MFNPRHKSTDKGKGLVAIEADSKISSTFENFTNIYKIKLNFVNGLIMTAKFRYKITNARQAVAMETAFSCIIKFKAVTSQTAFLQADFQSQILYPK